MVPWTAGEAVALWLGDPLNWGLAALFLVAGLLVRIKGRERRALPFILLAWQLTALQLLRCIHDSMVFITHQGGREIVEWQVFGAAVQLLGSSLLTLPVLLAAARRELHDILWEHRGSLSSCLLSLISVLLVLLGAAIIIPSHNPESYWGWPAREQALPIPPPPPAPPG